MASSLNSMLLAPFNPVQISGSVLWIDSNDPVGTGIQPADNSSVATLVDKSGQGNNYTQSTGANKATFHKNIQNGLGALFFNGTTNFYSGGSSGFPTGSNARTVFGAFITASGFGGQSIVFIYGNNTSGQAFGIQYENIGMGKNFTMNVYGSGVIAQTTNFNDSTPYVFEVNYPGSSARADASSLVVNGISQSNSVNSTVLNSGTTFSNISTYNDGTGGFFSNYMLELIFYNRSLTSAEQSAIRKYLRIKWNLY